MTSPGSKLPGSGPPATPSRRPASGTQPALRRTASGQMLAMGSGQPSSGQFRSANPEGDAFRPLLELGRGGMARVYLAEKTSRGLRRLVVLKVLEPTLASDPEMRSLFRREAEVCARLHHPNVVQVFEVVEEAATPYMVMEYVEGVSLSQVLARSEQRLPVRLHVHALIQVLAALHYFHELKDESGNPLHGVHRDVSPQNVLIMHEGAVKMLDFGVAKLRDPGGAELTRAGIIKGKLSYMPPEQLVGDASIDRRADIFAVGVMLWEAFARRRLWEGYDQHAMMKALVNGAIPSIREACPWLSKPLSGVVTRALSVRREDRFATALELQVALEDCMGELGGAVQQREVASFMEAEFGEWRRERQRSVDAELRKPAVALDDVLEVEEIEEIQVTSEASLQHGNVSSSIEASELRSRPRGIFVGLTLAALAAVLLLTWHFLQRGSVHAPRPASGGVASSVAVPARPAPSVAAAPVVVPVPSALPAPSAASSSEALKRPRRGVPQRSTPAAAHPIAPAPAAPSPVAAPARNCTPPYVLDAEGVKTYKPECL